MNNKTDISHIVWTSDKSVKLSKYITDFILVIVIISALAMPWIIGWYIRVTGKSAELKTVLMTVFYICVPIAVIALLSLKRLLTNITENKVFIKENTRLLRRLSWCCIAAAVVTLISGFFYLPFYIVGIASGFFAIILRVVKNVFCSAIEIKSENELTI